MGRNINSPGCQPGVEQAPDIRGRTSNFRGRKRGANDNPGQPRGTTNPYTKSFFGFTSVNGYQVNENFFAGAGLGLSFYDAGMLIPLFLDFRFAFSSSSFTPYLFGDGGLLLNPSDLNATKLFINPGVGGRYAINRNFALTPGAGILTQVDGTTRASFVNIKFGGVYVF